MAVVQSKSIMVKVFESSRQESIKYPSVCLILPDMQSVMQEKAKNFLTKMCHCNAMHCLLPLSCIPDSPDEKLDPPHHVIGHEVTGSSG